MKRILKNVIKCPHCGAEYLPAEIFLPDSFLGKPNTIQRDSENHIESFFGNDMDLKEEYRCDYCNKKFTVTANVKFNTASESKYIEEEYKTKLSKASLFLDED